MDNREIFQRLCDHVGEYRTRNGFIDIDCPFCGVHSTRQDPHFGFSLNGYNCFVCGAHGNLFRLAQHLRVPGFDGTGLPPIVRKPRPEPKPEPPPGWLERADELLDIYTANPSYFVPLWQKYKPLTAQTIHRHRFGAGFLPGMAHGSHRLIVPLFEDGKIVGLAGRSTDGSEPKWLVPKGTRRVMWNLDNVRGGDVPCFIMENYVDAALLMQETPQWDAVALGMARNVRPEEVQKLRDKGVKRIVVVMDNDLAGQASGKMRQKLAREWKDQRGIDPPAQGAGDKMVKILYNAGFHVTKYVYPEFAPPKADMGWLLTHGGVAA